MAKHKYILTILEVLLVSYFAWRSWDFMVLNLAEVTPTVAYTISLVYVLASDVAYLLWRHVALPEANTSQQEAVASVMSWLLLFTCVLTTAGDTLLHNTLFNLDAEWLSPILLFLPVFVVLADAVGVKLYQEADSEHLQHMAERELEHAEVDSELEIRRQAIRQLRGARAELAEKLSPHMARDVRARIEGRSMSRYARQYAKETGAIAELVESAPLESSKNGPSPKGR